jgi:hypothetical protein
MVPLVHLLGGLGGALTPAIAGPCGHRATARPLAGSTGRPR